MRDRRGRKVAVSIWGKPQKRVSIDVSEDVLMFLAWQAFCDIRCVSGGICVCDRPGRKVAVSIWGKPQKRVSIDVSEDVLMSFCVAGVALCDIRRVSGDRPGRKVAVWGKP